MKKQVPAALGALALGLAFQIQAAPVAGSMDKVSNGCISPIPFFVGQDCSYNGSNPISFGAISYIGPMAGGLYAKEKGRVSWVNPPVKAARVGVTGDLTITGVGPGAVLSGSFSIGATGVEEDRGNDGMDRDHDGNHCQHEIHDQPPCAPPRSILQIKEVH